LRIGAGKDGGSPIAKEVRVGRSLHPKELAAPHGCDFDFDFDFAAGWARMMMSSSKKRKKVVPSSTLSA
jgi:hypothetical protein